MSVFQRMPVRAFFVVFSCLLSVVAMPSSAHAQSFETRANQALLLDVETGSILFSKKPDDRIPPASLAKLMTMEVVFNAISIGRLSLDDEFVVSENAWRSGGTLSGGSTMFAELNSSIRLEDLIKGVIVQSANDGCIIIAEGMAGSEENFARVMTERARAIGLEDSVFVNSTGLPAEGQFVTMRDLVKLAEHLQREYPEFYQFYSLREFEWNNIKQRNRNPLLGMNIGADGVKTGFTEASGYAIVGSTVVNGRRLIMAMSGLADQRARREEARKMLEWGRRAFVPYRLFEDEQPVGSVRLYGGETTSVEVLPEKPLRVMLPLTGNDEVYRARIYYDSPVRAPIEEGDEIATLRLFLDDEIALEAPLFAANDVAKGPIHRQAFDAFTEFATGWIPEIIE